MCFGHMNQFWYAFADRTTVTTGSLYRIIAKHLVSLCLSCKQTQSKLHNSLMQFMLSFAQAMLWLQKVNVPTIFKVPIVQNWT